MKKFDKIDFVMVFAIILFLVVGTLSVVNAQTKIVGQGFTIETSEQFTTIVFEDGLRISYIRIVRMVLCWFIIQWVN